MTVTAPAPLETGRVRLRPVELDDYPFIKALELSPDRLVSYRHRGLTPAPEAFGQRLWQGVLTQFVVERVADGRPLGLVAAYNVDFRNGHALLALVAAGNDDEVAGLALEGTECFVDYLFATFAFQKLYAHVLEVNYPAFARLVGPVAALEGVLRGHEFHNGRWVDLCILAIHRGRWAARHPMFSTRGLIELADASDSVGPPTLAEFCRRLQPVLGIALTVDDDVASRTLVGDLGLDSLGLLQVLDVVEGPAIGALDPEAVAAIVTVGDAFHFYAALRERRGSGPTADADRDG